MCNSNWFQTEPAVKVNMMTDEANLCCRGGQGGICMGGGVPAV